MIFLPEFIRISQEKKIVLLKEYIGKKYLKQIACYKDNIIDDLCKMFLNFSHPERVDFWYGGDFIQILEDCLDLIAKHKEF